MTARDALDAARQAWERSQPQLFIDLWPDRGLEEPPTVGVRGGSSSPPTPPSPLAVPAPAGRAGSQMAPALTAPARHSPDGRDSRRQ